MWLYRPGDRTSCSSQRWAHCNIGSSPQPIVYSGHADGHDLDFDTTNDHSNLSMRAMEMLQPKTSPHITCPFLRGSNHRVHLGKSAPSSRRSPGAVTEAEQLHPDKRLWCSRQQDSCRRSRARCRSARRRRTRMSSGSCSLHNAISRCHRSEMRS